MLTGTRHVQQDVSKPMLFSLVAAIVVGVIAPITVPHVAHPTMIYHVVLHIAGIAIASFLSIVSIAAYRRADSARTLFMTIGFIALGISEVFYLIQAAGIPLPFYIPNGGIEPSHIITLVMLAMFGVGVLKVSK
jgi:predicted membrane metal-binding protein